MGKKLNLAFLDETETSIPGKKAILIAFHQRDIEEVDLLQQSRIPLPSAIDQIALGAEVGEL